MGAQTVHSFHDIYAKMKRNEPTLNKVHPLTFKGEPQHQKGLRRPFVWRRIEVMKVKLAYCHSKLHAFVAVEFEIYSSLVSSFEQCMKFL